MKRPRPKPPSVRAPMARAYLSDDEVREAAQAATRAGGESYRTSLAAGLELPQAPASMESDLRALNAAGAELRLLRYLDRAAALAERHDDASVLLSAARSVAERALASGRVRAEVEIEDGPPPPDVPVAPEFVARAARAASSVASVDAGGLFATGFLLGPRHLLTSYQALRLGGRAKELGRGAVVRFDKDAVHLAGYEVRATSCPAHNEALGYAVLALAEDTWRTPLRLASAPARPGEPAHVVWHVLGSKRLALGGVVLALDEHHLLCDASSYPGDFGATVCSSGWEVVGLHTGDATFVRGAGRGPRAHRAVRIDRVAADLAQRFPALFAELAPHRDGPAPEVDAAPPSAPAVIDPVASAGHLAGPTTEVRPPEREALAVLQAARALGAAKLAGAGTPSDPETIAEFVEAEARTMRGSDLETTLPPLAALLGDAIATTTGGEWVLYREGDLAALGVALPGRIAVVLPGKLVRAAVERGMPIRATFRALSGTREASLEADEAAPALEELTARSLEGGAALTIGDLAVPATSPVPVPLALHAINLAPGGIFRTTGAFATTPADVDAIIAAALAHPSKRLTLHFHGGLVDEAAGLGIARRMARTYAGASHAATFVWETGLEEILRANLASIWTTKLFQKLANVIADRVLEALGLVRSPGLEVAAVLDPAARALELPGAAGFELTAPAFDLAAAERSLELALAQDFAADADALRAAVREAALGGAASPAFNVPGLEGLGIQPPAAPESALGAWTLTVLLGHTVKIGVAVLRRFASGRDHGVWCTVIEEVLRELYLANLGAFIWGRMKASAEQMWQVGGGGRYLLDRLAALPEKPAIDLVGHSAGSIAICHLVSALERDQLPITVRGVYFLGPACRYDLFASTLLAHPGRYARFRMFTMHDAHEANDALIDGVPYLYPRSLLYLVSGVFEDEADQPILGMHRYLAARAPYLGPAFDPVRTFLAREDRVRLSPHPECGALDHGRFDDDAPMLATLRRLVETP